MNNEDRGKRLQAENPMIAGDTPYASLPISLPCPIFLV
jgi:hypothetical protein